MEIGIIDLNNNPLWSPPVAEVLGSAGDQLRHLHENSQPSAFEANIIVVSDDDTSDAASDDENESDYEPPTLAEILGLSSPVSNAPSNGLGSSVTGFPTTGNDENASTSALAAALPLSSASPPSPAPSLQCNTTIKEAPESLPEADGIGRSPVTRQESPLVAPQENENSSHGHAQRLAKAPLASCSGDYVEDREVVRRSQRIRKKKVRYGEEEPEPPRKRLRQSADQIITTSATQQRHVRGHLDAGLGSRLRLDHKSKHLPSQVIPSPPSTSSDEETSPDASQAKYEEWSLEDARLKRVTVGGLATFQFEFSWPCSKYGHRQEVTGRRLRVPAESLKQVEDASATPYGEDEDALIIKLKEELGLSWEDIKKQFPGRSKGSLQVRYCTKLKKRMPK